LELAAFQQLPSTDSRKLKASGWCAPAIDRGISFMDNSWDIHEGESEVRMGKALQDGLSPEVFLMKRSTAGPKRSRSKQIGNFVATFADGTISTWFNITK